MRSRTNPTRAIEEPSPSIQLRPGATAPTRIPVEDFALRAWRKGDEPALVRHADNIKIWRNLHDAFPHPYTPQDAVTWIEMTTKLQPGLIYAIEVEGEAAGGIGITPMKFEHRRTAAIGYWLSELYWGRGITTKAMRAMTDHAFSTFDLVRLEALVFEWNIPSTRVLEKVGYTQEARMKKRVTKEGRTVDCFLYALVRE